LSGVDGDRAYRGHVAGRRPAGSALAAALAGALLVGCADDPDPSRLDAASALAAIVEWQADQWTPPTDADEGALPVIYLVAADGDRIDVAVQASVTKETAEEAKVRFADEASESFDTAVDGAPVHDDGVLLAVGVIPDPARRMTLEVDRYVAKDDAELFLVEVEARHPTTNNPQRAEITKTSAR
jgi:hypothetical protein